MSHPIGRQLPAHLSERYRLVSFIGQGGWGQVLLCADRAADRQVVVKLVQVRHGDTEGPARHEREARILEQLSHPNIVKILDYGTSGDTTFLVMEWLPGRSLGEVLASARLEHREVRAVLCGVLRGLATVHARGVIHRDLKPSNVLITPTVGPVLIDFGLARPVDPSTILTTGRDLLGTPLYLAPELFDDCPHGFSSDLFAVGATGYECLTGSTLHTGGGAEGDRGLMRILSSLCSGAYAATAARTLRSHGRLGQVVLRALSPTPSARWPTAQAMLEALEDEDGAALPAS